MLSKHITDINDGAIVRRDNVIPDLIEVDCEACGKTCDRSHMLNVSIVCGCPGHPLISGFQCLDSEHWACSIACWQKVAHACIDEHALEYIVDLNSVQPDSKHYSDAHNHIRTVRGNGNA